MEPEWTLDEIKAEAKAARDRVCPSTLIHDGFQYSRKIVNKTTVHLDCKHNRTSRIKCQAALFFNRHPVSKCPHQSVDMGSARLRGLHHRSCALKNGLNLNDPSVQWDRDFQFYEQDDLDAESNPFFALDDLDSALPSDDGLPPLEVPAAGDRRSFDESSGSLTGRSSSSSESAPKVRIVERPVVRVVDVTEDMKQMATDLALKNLSMHPTAVWDAVKKAMHEKQASWTGLHRQQVMNFVNRVRSDIGGKDKIKTLEDDPKYRDLPNSNPFLQFHGWLPHPDKIDEICRYMIFANPVLLSLLLSKGLDIFIDATFAMTPLPFYQVLIVMVYDYQTELYVPVIYALMTHKIELLYWRVLSELITLSNWKMNVQYYTSDFEKAIMNACKDQFPEAEHVGCYFHFKQAICKYMIEKLKFDRKRVSHFMKDIEILTIIPIDDIHTFGIPIT